MPLTEEDKQQFLSTDLKPSSKLNLDRASFLDPDKQAEIITLAESRKIPMDTVERNLPELQRREKVELADTTDYPKLTDWMREDKNARVSFDDLDNLKSLERALTDPSHNIVSNTVRKAGDRVNELTGNLLGFAGVVGGSIDQFMARQGIPVPGFDDEGNWTWDMDIKQGGVSGLSKLGEGISSVSAYDYRPDFTWENLKGDITAKNLSGYIIEQGFGSIPDMLAAIYTLPAYLASRTEEIAEERVLNNNSGNVTTKDLVTSLVPAMITVMLERLGAKMTFGIGGAKTVGGALKATGVAALAEGTTEFLQEGVEYLGGTVGTDKPVDLAEMFDRQLAGLVAGSGFGGGIRATTSTFEVAMARQSGRNAETSIVTMAEQQVLDNIITYAQESKTRERKSDRFQQFIKELDPDRKVYISSEVIKEGMADGVEFPSYIIDQLDGLDTDVVIGVDQFATDIAPNEELIEMLRPHIKMSGEALTQTEIRTDEDLTIKSLLEKAEKSQELKSQADEIYEQVKEQIIATGRQSEATAKYSAAIIPAYVTVKAEQTGKSVEEIYKMMGLKVVGPKEDVTPKPKEPSPIAPKKGTTTGVAYKQDFGDLKFEETRILSTTGKKVKITESAKTVWNKAIKRKNQAEKLKVCLNG